MVIDLSRDGEQYDTRRGKFLGYRKGHALVVVDGPLDIGIIGGPLGTACVTPEDVAEFVALDTGGAETMVRLAIPRSDGKWVLVLVATWRTSLSGTLEV